MEDIKEKTADEMFEELGYEYSECYCEDNLEEIYYTKKGKYTPQIKISLYHKVIKVFRKEEKASSFDMKLLQAINKKCKELKWI